MAPERGKEIECKICGDPIIFMNIQLCDHCLKVLRQIAEDPELLSILMNMVPDNSNSGVMGKFKIDICFINFWKKLKQLFRRFIFFGARGG